MANCCFNNMMLCVAFRPQTVQGRENIYIWIFEKKKSHWQWKALHFWLLHKTPPPKKIDDFFVISGGLVCQYQSVNPPHHLTILPNPPDPAATLMMMIVECANPLNHSYFPAICSWRKNCQQCRREARECPEPFAGLRIWLKWMSCNEEVI